MENDIKEMMNPSKVFLPIDETAILKIKSKTVLKGELLYTYLQKDFYSPVSGYIKNIVKRKCCYYKNSPWCSNGCRYGISRFTYFGISF